MIVAGYGWSMAYASISAARKVYEYSGNYNILYQRTNDHASLAPVLRAIANGDTGNL